MKTGYYKLDEPKEGWKYFLNCKVKPSLSHQLNYNVHEIVPPFSSRRTYLNKNGKVLWEYEYKFFFNLHDHFQ